MAGRVRNLGIGHRRHEAPSTPALLPGLAAPACDQALPSFSPLLQSLSPRDSVENWVGEAADEAPQVPANKQRGASLVGRGYAHKQMAGKGHVRMPHNAPHASEARVTNNPQAYVQRRLPLHPDSHARSGPVLDGVRSHLSAPQNNAFLRQDAEQLDGAAVGKDNANEQSSMRARFGMSRPGRVHVPRGADVLDSRMRTSAHMQEHAHSAGPAQAAAAQAGCAGGKRASPFEQFANPDAQPRKRQKALTSALHSKHGRRGRKR